MFTYNFFFFLAHFLDFTRFFHLFPQKKAAFSRFFTLRSEYFNDLHGQVGDSGAD